MATKDIIVKGSNFRCPVGWTVDQAETKIRSVFGLQFGGLTSDGIPQLGSELVVNITGTLAFVGGQPVQLQGEFLLAPLFVLCSKRNCEEFLRAKKAQRPAGWLHSTTFSSAISPLLCC